MLFRNVLHLLELIRPHGARTNISDFPRLHKIMEGFHRLLWLYCGVVSMDLQQVDVVGVQSLQACIYGIEDGLPRQTSLIDVVFGVLQLRVSEPSVVLHEHSTRAHTSCAR